MPQQIGWSVEAKLLYEIKQLTKQLSGREYIAVYANFAAFPIPGVTGTLYVDQATGDIYVWNGTSYVLLSAGITALNGLIAAAQLLVTGSAGTDFNISSVGTTHTFNIPTASAGARGLLSSTDWSTFNNKQNAITLTTTGTSGAATLVGSTLNIPQYQSALTNPITGTGTTNYLSKFTGTTTLGNSQIFDNGTNVGIGTTSPGSKLTISNAGSSYLQVINTNTTNSLFVGNNAGNGYIETSGAYATIFQNNGAERMRIDSVGNVGIGVTPSAWNSSYKAIQVGNAGTLWSATSANSDISLSSNNYFTNSSTFIYLNNGFATDYYQYLGQHIWRNAPNGTAGNTVSFTQAMTLTASGKLLIGTTTDAGAYALQVSGAIYNTAAAVLAASGFNDVRIGSTSGRQIIGIAPGMLQVWDNPGNYGGITINGQNANNAFGNYLQFIKSRGTGNTAVQNGDELGGLYFAGADGTNYIRAASMRALIDATPGTNDMPTALVFETTADGGTIPSERMRITSTGDVGIGTTSPQGKLDVFGPLLIGNGLLTHQTNRGVLEYSNSITALRSYGANAGDGVITFRTGGGGGSADAERMRITAVGDVAIGTTTADPFSRNDNRRVAIDGTAIGTTANVALSLNAGATAGRGAQIYMGVGGTRHLTITSNSNETTLGIATATPMIFQTSNTERMRITAGGNVLIGTTTDSSFKLRVNGNVEISTQLISSADMVVACAVNSQRVTIGDNNTANSQVVIGGSGPSAYILVGSNFGLSQTTFGTNATKTIAISTGVAPTTSPVDAIQMYSADVVAGNAAPHFRTENGAVVKVYQETTGVGAATFVQGSVNAVYEDSTFDGYTLKQIVKALRNQGLLA